MLLLFRMAIYVGFPQTSQDFLTSHAAAFPPPPQIQPQHCYNYMQIHPNMFLLDHQLDHYITLQGENLSMKLQEQRKRQVATILSTVELNVRDSMGQKDEEIASAAKKRMELECLLDRLEAENQAWRRAAVESEALILSLNNSLEKMKEKAHSSFNNVLAHDAQSCWDESGGDYQLMEGEEEETVGEMTACKSCKCGVSSFLFLPCRHLSSCKACEPFLQACPVCTMPKRASIEALIF
ncbi:probable BOI-related E3 ubiquitin-protein ligase 3 [Prosopis cineraria]|uniref:probable BOI-related E3 ubiquitin-protein ligase 3 n=1 Tax=Prosopis cineraria TaxID=364024 RepID=UPI00240FE49D|nr:probable BOI-related E3 ubiquitin-protein ligase 3 [Prosopis cineraria]